MTVAASPKSLVRTMPLHPSALRKDAQHDATADDGPEHRRMVRGNWRGRTPGAGDARTSTVVAAAGT